MKKQKWLNVGPKVPYLSIFDQKTVNLQLSNCKISRKNKNASIWDQIRLIWVFLGKNIKTTIVRYEISTFNFVYLQNFTKKQKCLNLGPKMLDLFFLRWNLKTVLPYLISAPSNFSNRKILRKNRNAQMSNQKCLIRVFLSWNFRKFFSYLKSAPLGLSNFKIL